MSHIKVWTPSLERSEVLIHVITWMTPENMGSKRSQTQKTILYDSIYIKSKEIIYNERKQISGYLRTGIGQEDGMTGKRGKKGHKGAQGNFCSDRQVHYLGYKYIYI